jgi:outer membrane protein assembly factor BamB
MFITPYKGGKPLKKHLISLMILFLLVSTVTPMIPAQTDNTLQSSNAKLENDGKIQAMDDGFIDFQWPMYGHDAQNTCRSEYDASQNEGYEKWKYFVDSALNLLTPVIDGNGTLYITSSSKGLHAIYPNGTRKWQRDLVGFTEFQPIIGLDGIIYAGTTQGFHAFYPNGTLRWTLPIGGDVCGKPVVSPDGIIYVGTSSGYLYAVNPNGTIEWDYNLGYRFIGTSLDAEGNIYFTARSCDYLYSLSPNGTFRWRFETVMNTADAPLIGDDGMIYTVPIYDVIAINPDGTEKWRVPCEHGMSPALSPDGTIVYSSHDSGKVMGIDPDDGHVLWTYEVGLNPSHKTRAVVSGDGLVFFAYTDELGDTAYLTALNPDGTMRWTAGITSDFYPYDGMSVDNPPSIGEDGTIYVTTWYYGASPIYHDFGYVHAFGQLDPNAPTAPTITGPIKGKVGVQQEYTFTSTSPTGSDLYYYALWGDGTYVDWTEPFLSGEPVSLNHTWSERGTYTIQARARDSDNLRGPWGKLEVTMPFSYEPQHPFIQWLLGRFPNPFPLLRYLIRFS